MWIAYSFAALLLVAFTHTDTADQTECTSYSDCLGGDCYAPNGPFFDQNEYSVEFDINTPYDSVILEIFTCPDKDQYGVEFSLEEDPEGFEIGLTSGQLVANAEAYGRTSYLSVRATLVNTGDSATVPVTVIYTGDDVDSSDDHSRQRRAADYSVTDVTFNLVKVGSAQNQTEVHVGSKIEFELTIQFPPGTTDMLVEIFTPDNDTTVMALCNVQVAHCGVNFGVDCAGIQATVVELEAKTAGSLEYDRAILDFGNRTNDNSTHNSPDDSSIRITYEAVVLDNDQTVNGSEYFVSAGAEYANEAYIWVGQASFTAIMDQLDAIHTPVFNVSCPDTIEIGTSILCTVEMCIAEPAPMLYFDAFAPLNSSGAVSVCSGKIIGVGSNLACLLDTTDVLPTVYPFASYNGNERMRLEIGKATNKGSRDPLASVLDSCITAEVVFSAIDDVEIIGNSYWLGFALEIGTDKIWAGQVKVFIAAQSHQPETLPSTPVISMVIPNNQVSVGQGLVVEVEMDLPEASQTHYSIEFLSPVNDSLPRFAVCHIGVVFQGENLPCTREDTEPVFTVSGLSTSDKTDHGILDLGRLRNTGYFNPDNYTDANKLRVSAVYVALDHPLNTDGAEVSITAGMKYSDPTNLWVAQTAVFIAENSSSSGSSLTAAEYPDMAMVSLTPTDLPVGAMAVVELTITTKPGAMYYPMDVEVIVPYDSGAIYQLCDVQVTHVGVNMPCSDINTMQTSIQNSSKDLNDIIDKFWLTLGFVYNSRSASQPLLNADDDLIKLRIALRVLDHPSNLVGFQEWLSAGLQFDQFKLWVGQLGLTIAAAPAFTSLYSDIIRQDGVTNDELYIGKSVLYTLVIKADLYSMGDLIVKASVSDPKLSICSVQLMSVGESYGCSFNTDLNATYTIQGGTVDTYDSGELDMGVVTNAGSANITENSTIDADSIVVVVVVHLHDTAADGDSLTVTFDLLSGGSDVGGGQTATIIARTPVQITNTASETLPTYNFQLAQFSNETINPTIAPGQALKFYFDVYFAESSSNYYSIKFLAPVNYTGAMEICSVIVLSVGRNLPCLRREMYQAVSAITSRSGSIYADIGSLDLGYVCQVPLFNDTEENKIRLEVVARGPVHTLSLEPDGTELWLSATSRVNDDQIYVSQLALTLDSDGLSTFAEPHHLVSQALAEYTDEITALNIRPGDTFNVSVKLTVPQNTVLRGLLDIQVPVFDSAVMTITSIKVNPLSGANLACLTNHADLDFEPTLVSTKSTSQMNKGEIDLLFITNSGQTLRDDVYALGDDDVVVDLELMMADSSENTAGSAHNVSTVVTLGDATLVADRVVSVFRDNAEEPIFKQSANVTNDTITYDNTLEISIDTCLEHEWNSSAEGYNISLTFYHPTYLGFSLITNTNLTETSNAPVAHPRPGGDGVDFAIDHLYFTDVICWTFTLSVQSAVADLPSGQQQDATTPYEVITHMIHRPNNEEPEGHFFTTELTSLEFSVIPSIGVMCAVGKLGFEDGSIQDCQITGSYFTDSSYPPSRARKGGDGFKMSNRDEKYKKFVQVYFGNITKVTKVHLETPAAFTSASVTQYTLYASNDGITWTAGETVTGPTTPTTLTAPVEGRYLRFVVDAHNGASDDDIGVKLEFEGCYSSADVSPSDVCQSNKPWYQDPSALSRRSYMAGGGAGFFCDVDPNDDTDISCHSSTDGATWKTLDKSVANVLAFNATSNLLYGMAADKRTYVVSDDLGTTWYSIPQSKYARDAGSITHTDLPWVYSAKFRDGQASPDTDFGSTATSWGANWDGVYFYGGSWSKVADWTSCCG